MWTTPNKFLTEQNTCNTKQDTDNVRYTTALEKHTLLRANHKCIVKHKYLTNTKERII